jgi:alpha-D-ribose 1-methylphosphonate 5-triphosphate synthase subunit PhnL
LDWILKINGLKKSFCLHTQGGARIPVLDALGLTLYPQESLALTGPSGAGKSTVLKLIYGNYKIESGHLLIRHKNRTVDICGARSDEILDIRKWTVGYVSQFLRVIPRVPSLQVVMEPLRARGVDEKEARDRAGSLLKRLRIPENLWSLSPTTFSGGEQQRINLARSFIADYPLMILDEPTASLDPANTDTVLELIHETLNKGTAMIGIFHDARIRSDVATRQMALAS